MHPAPLFLETDQDTLITRAQAHPFALVTSVWEGRPVAAHAPIIVEEIDGAPRLRFHLAAPNPVCKALEAGATALVIFTGDHAYVSPDWYELPDQVGTWNYLSVEAEGVPELLDDASFTALLDDLSDVFERDLLPKPMWSRDKMSEGKFERMLRSIRGFALTPTRFEGITKLAQYKPADARARVSAKLRETNSGVAIADAMDKLPE